ncbi:MAG: hypothetical protein ACYDB4_18730 [Candidatus Dormibacteraceae bacterium]
MALVPAARRSKASFPIERDDIFAKHGRRYVIREPERRRRFNSAIRGMSPKAIAEVKELQPYRTGKDARLNTLYLLSRLENADKHRQLIPFAAGLNHVDTSIRARGRELSQQFGLPSDLIFVPDGAEVAHFGHGDPALQESEVQVQVRGAVQVAIKIVEVQRYKTRVLPGFMPFDVLLEAILHDLSTNVIPTLERFVRKQT